MPEKTTKHRNASNVDRLNERKWFYTEKGKKQTMPHANYY